MQSPHPSFEEILDAAEGRPDSESVAAHVAGCDTCRPVATRAASILAALSEARGLEEVPRELRDRALDAVRRELDGLRSAPHGAGGFLGDLVAHLRDTIETTIGTLVADSLQASAATRAGAEVTATPRMLLYETPDYDITLSIAAGPTAGILEIAGQVTPRAGELPTDGIAGIEVGDHTATSSLTAHGEFAFDAVPRGAIAVEIGLGGTIIRLEPIPRHGVE
jgi:hypothetical protein